MLMDIEQQQQVMESETLMDYQWCHGPHCHERHIQQDRVRGVKGSKVLRTMKNSLSFSLC